MSGAPALRMAGVRKAFGPTVALDGVELEVAAGEVHALLGENGAGKSTLMKVLAGAIAPDAGTIELLGAPFRPRDPAAARARGVAMIYQELSLAPHLSVAANVGLGREATWLGIERRAAMATRTRAALALLDHAEVAPGQRVQELGAGVRQVVEIARALAHDARVVVLDEPTSSLAARDVERLLAVVRRLAGEGIAVVYISHFLEEVKRVADRFTVLRDGRSVATGGVAATEVGTLIEHMAGRKLGELYPARRGTPGAVVLRARALRGDPLPCHADLELRRGEVLGIAGLCGAGRTELLRTLLGLSPVRGGTIEVAGGEDRGAAPARRLDQGVGMLAEDRAVEGLCLSRSIAENLTLMRTRDFGRLGWIARGRRDACARRWIERLGIKARHPRQSVAELSGGNQQKVALGRLLHHDAEVLLLDEPTRGIAVRSKAEIYAWIADLAARGKAILLVSSHLPELLGLCDRIAVMHRGRLGPGRPATAWTEHGLLTAATAGEGHG